MKNDVEHIEELDRWQIRFNGTLVAITYQTRLEALGELEKLEALKARRDRWPSKESHPSR